MGTQVNNLTGKQALQAVKAYVDKQATAQVIRTETVLFDGEASVSSANNLNQSLANFDAVRIVASSKNTTDGSLWAMTEQEFGIEELTNSSPKMSATEYSNTSGTGATAAGGYTLTLLFTDTTFSITRTGNSNWITHNPTVRKVYGIKYTVPENYSTDEQIIGTWIDGKPLYQRTITGTSPSASGDMPLGLTNVDKIFIDSGYLEAGSYNYIMSMPGYYSGASDFCSVDIMPDKTGVYFQMANARWANRPFVITFKYTKTTDTGGA